MIPEYCGRIAFRLADDDRRKIEQLIKSGKYKNISEVIRQALTEFLKQN
jgi:Arc/MetJ-type ribon-helix-helix transcriptional regulator